MTGRAIFLDRQTLAPAIALNWPEKEIGLDLVCHDRTVPDQIVERMSGAAIAITNKVPFDRQTLEQLPDLKLIAIAATGHDIIDLDAAKACGVSVCNVRGYAETTVPEHVFALMLALSRSIHRYRGAVLDGRWQEADQFCFFDYPILDLAGRTLGLIGSGTIGRAVARRADAFGMHVLNAERKGAATIRDGYHPFEEVLARADILSLHCPLTEATRGLMDDEAFAAMARRPILINTARGGLIDEAALERALDAGRISGAGLDVTTPEPPPADSRIMAIARRGNVILTPHTAWASTEAQQALADQMVGNVAAFVAGQPRNLLT